MQHPNKPKQTKPKPKQTIPLLELLAFNATGQARKLLLKYGKEDANDYQDLQSKLSDLYKSEKDKIEIEKAFAEIHPHKDFILKYLTPPAPVTTVTIAEPTSACEGNDKQINTLQEQINKNNFLIAVVGIVGIVALVIYTKK